MPRNLVRKATVSYSLRHRGTGEVPAFGERVSGLQNALTRAAILERHLSDGLVDDPDCLAELEFTYSVFRFRYAWGTVYEATFTNHADGQDRDAALAVIPSEAQLYVDTFDTDTMGVGFNGVIREVTHRMFMI